MDSAAAATKIAPGSIALNRRGCDTKPLTVHPYGGIVVESQLKTIGRQKLL